MSEKFERGVYPIRQDIEVLPADKTKQLKLGWTVTETIGIGIINPTGIAHGRIYMVGYAIDEHIKNGLTVREAVLEELKRNSKNAPLIKDYIAEKYPEHKEEIDKIIVLS